MITYTSSSAFNGQWSSNKRPLLKYQRLLRGWSQQDVAEELYKLCAANGRPEAGIGIQQVCRWETGRCKPSPFYRKYLCQLYNLTADLLGLIDPQEVQG